MSASIIPLSPFTHSPYEEREKQKKQPSAASSPGARAYAHAREGKYDLQPLARYSCATFGRRTCAPSILRQITEALDAGMDEECIMCCIDAAAEAEMPSWAYAAAVIRRCIADGALTAEAFGQRAARHRAQRQTRQPLPIRQQPLQQQRTPNALNYPQRSYQEGELDYIFTNLSTYIDKRLE